MKPCSFVGNVVHIFFESNDNLNIFFMYILTYRNTLVIEMKKSNNTSVGSLTILEKNKLTNFSLRKSSW